MRDLISAWYWLCLAACGSAFADNASAACAQRLLVSGYNSTLHVYDACSGDHLRPLDPDGRIAGPQAVKIGPDGLLWVVSERNGRILRYRADSYEFVDVFADVGPAWGVTGLAFGAAGDVYLSSYARSVLRRYRIADGSVIGGDLSAGALLRGPDNGFLAAPDGKLYIPGYDSSNVVRYDPATGRFDGFVAAGADGILNTRGLLLSADGTKLYVSSERSGRILRYVLASGNLDREIAGGLGVVTGIAWHPDGSLLAALGNGAGRVVKLDPETGQSRGELVSRGAGGLAAPTYVAVIPAPASADAPDPATIGSQYFIVGLAALDGHVLDIPDAYTGLGTAFGDAFDPVQVRRLPWGRIRMTFLSCTEADFEWQSSGPGSAGFGDGGYRMRRLIANPATLACERAGGIDAVQDRLWVVGSWYGGPARSGEGLMLDITTDDRVFLTWYTHRPAVDAP
jgi:sugar lactone lactonase YvrE